MICLMEDVTLKAVIDSHITVNEAAERSGFCTRTIWRRIADGSLTAYRHGPRRIVLSAAEVDSLLRRA